MTFYEAASLAAKANANELWLTHFSPSLTNPKQYMDEVRDIFPNAYLGKNNKKKELAYKEEEDE